MARLCECGEPIPETQGRSRPRQFCLTCRPRRNRPNPRLLAAVPQEPGPGDGAVVDIRRPAEAEPAPSTLLGATMLDLRRVERHETTRGIAAMHLAKLLDAGGYTAQGAAALVRAHREALELALEGTAPEADVIDAIFGASG